MACAVFPVAASAQTVLTIGASAVAAVSHVAPAVFGENRTEGYLTQPNVMGYASHGPLALFGTLNFEGYTLKRGELNAGIYGEGYVDRRHPHTLVHEVMATFTSPTQKRVAVSLAAGKGFVPYGTDDPMVRPVEKYPVNHHHAQIIERITVIGAVRVGDTARSVTLEHAFFNGDEPVGPFIGPQWKRFGDSRATRITVSPLPAVELQVSHAFVRSPGITQGGAFDHRQTSASARYDHGAVYALAEWARTDEGFGTSRAFRYHSALAEAQISRHHWSVAARAERTQRPENERLLDPFRMANGHIDFQIIGVTQWTIGSINITAPPIPLPNRLQSRLTPFVELSRAHAEAMRKPTVFEPSEFYGSSNIWTISAGMRLHMGQMRSRMGQYGVKATSGQAHLMSSHAH